MESEGFTAASFEICWELLMTQRKGDERRRLQSDFNRFLMELEWELPKESFFTKSSYKLQICALIFSLFISQRSATFKVRIDQRNMPLCSVTRRWSKFWEVEWKPAKPPVVELCKYISAEIIYVKPVTLFRHLLTGKTTEKLDASLDALIRSNLVTKF